MNTYREIFDRRGAEYHRAMLSYPMARAEEFRAVVGMADIADGHVVVDLPSGGGYLSRFIRARVTLYCVDVSPRFLHHPRAPGEPPISLCDDPSKTGLPDACADRVVSVASAHHLADRGAFFREVLRLLKPGGLFCLADVHRDSAAAGFLNGFVHEHSSSGHVGDFLSDDTKEELRACGFVVRRESRERYSWRFGDEAGMADFCQRLFGIDRADHATILEGIRRHVGVSLPGGPCIE